MKEYTWFNLPNQILKTIEPIKEQLTKEAQNITWFNLPNKLTLLYKELNILFPSCAVEKKFEWFNLPSQLEGLEDLLECQGQASRGLQIIDLTN